VSGTTGYDFANLVNGLFVDQSAVTRLERIYRNFIGQEVDIDDLAYQSRKLIIRVALASELNVLANSPEPDRARQAPHLRLHPEQLARRA
jgi:(1->4)-alpha-D-glucan 1-alpha-D-glucosylmutase